MYNTVSAIFGKRGTGKTLFLIGDEPIGITGLMNLYRPKDMKVLIVDTIDHPSYRHIPVIKPEKIVKWGRTEGTEILRTFVNVTQMRDLNSLINKNLWNALLVYEDAYKHQRKFLDGEILQLIGDSKQKNIDLLFMYHSWAMAPKDLYRYLDAIEIFKTKDSPEVREDDMFGYYDDAHKAWDEVMKHPSRWHHKGIDTEL